MHTSDQPWITKKLKTLIRKRQLAFHRHGRDSNCYKILREKVQREIRSAKQNFYEHKVSDLEQSNIKNWWKHIRRLTGQDNQQDWSHQFIGDNCPTQLTLANKINDFFISLTEPFPPLENLVASSQEVPAELLVSETEVLKALSAVKIG